MTTWTPLYSYFSWNVSRARYVQSFSVVTEETAPRGLFFKADGTKLYVIGSVSDAVSEYDLSIAWDISTASYVQNFNVSAQETSPSDVFFKTDGTKMYVLGGGGADVIEYDLSVAWDVSSSAYSKNFSVSAQGSIPTGLFFKPDGTKLYVIHVSSAAVSEYDLSVAWDVSTSVYSQSFSVAAQDANPLCLFFKTDGTKMYVIGNISDAVIEYDLSIAWDISTASYLRGFSVAAQELAPTGIFFKSDGDKMYVAGVSSDSVFEYDLNRTEWVEI